METDHDLSVWWQNGHGKLRIDGVVVPLVDQPPVPSLKDAVMVAWEPKFDQSRCIIGTECRNLTLDEQGELFRWAMQVYTDAIDARDGKSTLVVVLG